jgi:hypothetical protein
MTPAEEMCAGKKISSEPDFHDVDAVCTGSYIKNCQSRNSFISSDREISFLWNIRPRFQVPQNGPFALDALKHDPMVNIEGAYSLKPAFTSYHKWGGGQSVPDFSKCIIISSP